VPSDLHWIAQVILTVAFLITAVAGLIRVWRQQPSDLHWIAQVILAVAFLVKAMTKLVRVWKQPPDGP
jgi:hypothetical protein